MTRTLGGVAVTIGAVWYAVLMRPVLTAAALGPICRHGAAIALHCPACYAALALVGFGLALVMAAPAARPVASRASRRG